MTADDRRPMPPLPPPLHPDLDTLADLHADALDLSTAERVRVHVRGCAQCYGVLSALDAVGAELRGLPTPAMPAAVVARLDATFADLRRGARDDSPGALRPLLSAAPTPPDRGSHADPGAPADRTPGDRTGAGGPGDRAAPVDLAAARERKRRRRTRSLGAVAAAVAVIAAGSSITAIVRASTSGSDSGVSAAAGGSDSAEQLPAAGTATPNLGGPLTIPSYDRSTLRADLPAILRQSAVSIITGRGDTGPAGAMADTGRRTACANTIRGSSGELQGVLRIRYEGRPAYVFVFTDGDRRTAYVVSDDCGTSPALPAAVLDTVS